MSPTNDAGFNALFRLMHSEPVPDDIFRLYQSLQRYVGWTEEDTRQVTTAGEIVRSEFEALVDDFYQAIGREPETARLMTGGQEQIARLKKTLLRWLDELFAGVYDEQYVVRRWRVGRRHVEIGLRQVFSDAALARLRGGLQTALENRWRGDPREVPRMARSLNRLLDLELALIEDAYTTERLVEQRYEVRRQSEASFRKLVESARCIIVILRSDHTIAYFNPYAEQVTGYAAKDVLATSYLSTFAPQDGRSILTAEFDRILHDGATPADYESPVRCRNGARRHVLWNAQKLDDYDGDTALLTVGHDITELKKTQAQLLQSERLAAIGQTVAGLAHESRNAFQRSQACLEMLTLELEGRPNELELVDRIQRALDHLHHLYEEVRDYASPIKLERQDCDLTHVWRDAWTHLEVVRKHKQVRLQEQSSAGNLSCQVDWFQLGQVFRNVFENAISAVSEGGEILISCQETELDGLPAICVSIRDTGPGISPEIRDRVFNPFFTTKTKGTGLGMAIAKRIVEAHNGRIELGRPGTGAEIVITLPRE